MAPDRGSIEEVSSPTGNSTVNSAGDAIRSDGALDDKYDEAHHFTLRGIIVGLVLGVIICFSNMYFGLQTGWISSMAMPSALLGFSYFKVVSRVISYPFSPVENVLVQSVAGSVGTMPLGCGFVGVIPALNFLLTPSENGPLNISLTKLIIWALGIAFFGVVFAVPLRRQVILREQLKFPSGTAAAALIALLHGKESSNLVDSAADGRLNKSTTHELPALDTTTSTDAASLEDNENHSNANDWRARIRLLLYAFGFSALYVCFLETTSRIYLTIGVDTYLVFHTT
jgi:OPT family oligopeptide transporter